MKSLHEPARGLKSGIWQAILHLAVIYAIARLCTPWLLTIEHDATIPLVTGRPPHVDLQFFYSHLFALASCPGSLPDSSMRSCFATGSRASCGWPRLSSSHLRSGFMHRAISGKRFTTILVGSLSFRSTAPIPACNETCSGTWGRFFAAPANCGSLFQRTWRRV